MAIGDDFSVSPEKDIRYVGSGTYYRVLEFHRWLQDLADDATYAGNDVLDITDDTPSERATDNIVRLINSFNIDDTAAEHLYDGSIEQDNGDTLYSGLVVVGSVEAGTQLYIIQDNVILTDFWTGGGENSDPDANILLRIMVKTRFLGYDIDGKRIRVQARELGDTYGEFSTTLGFGNGTAAIFTSPDLNNATIEATIATWTDIVNTEGLNLIDIDNNTVAEEYYSQWDRASRSINALYERTKWLQRRGSASTLYGMNGQFFRGITHSLAYDNEATGPFVQNEVIAWGTSFNYDTEALGPFTLGEYLSFTSGAIGKLVFLDDLGTTGTMVVQKEPGTGTIIDNDVITGLASGATAAVNGTVTGNSVSGGAAALLTLGDDGTTGDVYIQLLNGLAPADNVKLWGVTSLATADVAGTPIQRTVSPAFLGQSTGTSIIGAYGIGIEAADLSNADQVFDLTNTLRTPPNNQTFTVNGLVIGDRVLVGPASGGLNTEQFTGATGSNAAAAGTWVVNESIPLDTPSAGDVRVYNGFSYDEVAYTSYSGSTFTLTGTLTNAGASHEFSYDTEVGGPFVAGETLTFGGAGTAELLRLRDDGTTGFMVVRMISGSAPVDDESITGGTSTATADVNGALLAVGGHVGYIDITAPGTSVSFAGVYQVDRFLFVRVRDGGASPIKTFETQATFGSGGGSATAVRTADT
jgi:hypothetical protein